jgi:hypothetical protein
MRCRACNKNLSDKEASLKYRLWKQIENPEERYIMLCGGCLKEAGLAAVENPQDSDEEYQDETLSDEDISSEEFK